MASRRKCLINVLIASLGLLTAAQNGSAQSSVYFQSLTIPPPSVGTCVSAGGARHEADAKITRGSRLVMVSRTPRLHREIQVVIDAVGRPLWFSEFTFATRGASPDGVDNVVAKFDGQGVVNGFRTHRAIQVSDRGTLRRDSASLRRMAAQVESQTSREPLDAAAQLRVRALVVWLRKRCPA